MVISYEAYRKEIQSISVALLPQTCDEWIAKAEATILEAQQIIRDAKRKKAAFTDDEPEFIPASATFYLKPNGPMTAIRSDYVPVEEAIIANLKRVGARTYNELYEDLSAYPQMSIYRACLEMLDENDMRLIYTRQGKEEGELAINPNWSGYDSFDRRVVEFTKGTSDFDDFTTRVAATMRFYQQVYLRQKHDGKRMRASRTWSAFEKHGVKEAIEKIVSDANPSPDDGFARLITLNPDMTFEKIVLDFPDKFGKATRDAAAARLGVNV